MGVLDIAGLILKFIAALLLIGGATVAGLFLIWSCARFVRVTLPKFDDFIHAPIRFPWTKTR